MKTSVPPSLLAQFALLAIVGSELSAAPPGTAFTYQGRLSDGANPGQGSYDLRFMMYDSSAGPAIVAGPILRSVVTARDGLFTTTLDFGTLVFTGEARWLEIGVRSNGSGAFTLLSPRQPLTPAPYALYASGAATLSGNAQIAGSVQFNSAAGPPFTVANPTHVQNLNADLLDGQHAASFALLNSSPSFSGTVTADRVTATAAEPPAAVMPLLGMVWIKPGTFIMGSRPDEPGRYSDEGPQTLVTLTRGLWMSAHEVTQAEYQSVTGLNPSHFTAANSHGDDPNRPVESVSWFNATNFCGLLTQTERAAGRIPGTWSYRLPTEAEWEYASRAGASTTRYGYGNDLSGADLPDHAWYTANSASTTHPVEDKPANAWGLRDMHGNVWEWCQDWYGPYPGGSLTDPQPTGSGSFRVIRGGSWTSSANYCRSALRNIRNPADTYSYLGFRVVLASSQP